MAKELCFECRTPMKKALTKIAGVDIEAYKCPKCKEIILTEKQAEAGALKIDAKRMKKEYSKRPIRIGHSYGCTFPKDIVEVFGIDKKNVMLKFHTDIGKKTIEIQVD